jgi:hypothetical protein
MFGILIRLSALNSKFSKIMVAIDGSPDSFKGAEYAIELASVARNSIMTKEATYFNRW